MNIDVDGILFTKWEMLEKKHFYTKKNYTHLSNYLNVVSQPFELNSQLPPAWYSLVVVVVFFISTLRMLKRAIVLKICNSNHVSRMMCFIFDIWIWKWPNGIHTPRSEKKRQRKEDILNKTDKRSLRFLVAISRCCRKE